MLRIANMTIPEENMKDSELEGGSILDCEHIPQWVLRFRIHSFLSLAGGGGIKKSGKK